MFERKWGIALCALAFTQVALAQLAGDDLDWKEAEVPTPPAFEIARLIPFEVTADSAIRFGLDPASISIGKDGVVRYVVVARSTSGVVTGLYEGIRCARGEFRTYARHNAGSGWAPAGNSEWKSIFAFGQSRHTLRLARLGACQENAPAQSAEALVRALKYPVQAP